MRILFMIIAALIGAAFAHEARALLGAILGAAIAFAIVEIGMLKRRSERLEEEVDVLRRRIASESTSTRTESRDAEAVEKVAPRTVAPAAKVVRSPVQPAEPAMDTGPTIEPQQRAPASVG